MLRFSILLIKWEALDERNVRMRKCFVLISIILIVLIINACAPASADPALVRDTSNELMCTCSCEIVLSNCDCPTATELTALIEKKLSQGQSKEQIIQYFVEQYGEQVLAAPTNP